MTQKPLNRIGGVFRSLRGSFSKGRRYPLKLNEEGRSARSLAFALFDQGYKPAGVVAQVEISVRTARRYYADWKHLPEKYDNNYFLMKEVLLRNPVTRAWIAQIVARELKIPTAAVHSRLSKPWAAKQLATGEWRNWAAEELEKRNRRRLQAATRVIEMYERRGVSLDRIWAALDGLLAQATRDGTPSPDAPPRPPGDPFAKLFRLPTIFHPKPHPRDEGG